jgi:hypothetical protein
LLFSPGRSVVLMLCFASITDLFRVVSRLRCYVHVRCFDLHSLVLFFWWRGHFASVVLRSFFFRKVLFKFSVSYSRFFESHVVLAMFWDRM